MSKDRLSASEALYGFMGWLSGREEQVVISSKDDCSPMVRLINEFCEVNDLEAPRHKWDQNLIHPSGRCSQVFDEEENPSE